MLERLLWRGGNLRSDTKNIWNRPERCGTNSLEELHNTKETRDLNGKLKKIKRKRKKTKRRND